MLLGLLMWDSGYPAEGPGFLCLVHYTKSCGDSGNLVVCDIIKAL